MKAGRIDYKGSQCTLFFIYTGPDLDWEFDERGDPVKPGARSLALALHDRLSTKSLHPSAIKQHSYYGWSFSVQYDRYSIGHVLNPVEKDVALTCDFRGPLVHFFRQREKREFQMKYMDMLVEVLKTIPGVTFP